MPADGDCSHEIKTLTPWKKSYDQPRQNIKKQRHYFAKKGPSSQGGLGALLDQYKDIDEEKLWENLEYFI